MFHVRNPNCRIAFWLVFTLLGQCERGYSDVVHNPPSAHCEVDATTGQCVIEENNEKIMSDPDHLDENHNHDQCTLYMAVSTIPGAGLGIFTGTERKVGDTIGNGDVMIAITDHWYHLKATIAPYSRLDWLHIDPMFDYVWNGAGLGMQRESAHSYAEGIEYVLGMY